MLLRERAYQRFPPPHYPRVSFSSVTKLNDDVSLVKIVSERYYPAMAAASDVSARTVAELVVQLGCLTRGEGFVAELTLAQWAALRYFFRANRFSRTVSDLRRRYNLRDA